MAVIAMILGDTGSGKTTSIFLNHQGVIPTNENLADYLSKDQYQGLNPDKTLIINADGGYLSIPRLGCLKDKWANPKTLLYNTSNINKIKEILLKVSNNDKKSDINVVIIDTINAIMHDIELSAEFQSRQSGNEARKKWMDLAIDIYDLIKFITPLRNNLVVYLMGHLYVDEQGVTRLMTNGRKLEKLLLESKLDICLHAHVETVSEGVNIHTFRTQRFENTAKSPIGMFSSYKIPNSLSLVDTSIRQYYGLN